jgi:POT family proton-dependent oligopeptide transporter
MEPQPYQIVQELHGPGFWDSAKPSKQVQKPPWMTFDDQWVDEVNRGLKAVRCLPLVPPLL